MVDDPDAAVTVLLAASEARNATDVSTLSEVGHFGLDVIGLIPGIGEWADGLNAVWYASEGRNLEAALSSAGMVPFAGVGATLSRWGLRAPGGLQRFNYLTDLPLTSSQIRALFEPVDGAFESFAHYRAASRHDWRPLSNTTYEVEGVVFQTDNLGRPSVVSGAVNPDRNVGRISGVDVQMGRLPGSVDGDIGFHLGGHQFGFPGGPLNIIPGSSVLNNGNYLDLERQIRQLHNAGVDVEVEFSAIL